MPATTNAKKEVIDFLWEWANTKGDWAQQLIDTIIRKERELDATERDLIFSYFLDSLRTKKQLPPLQLAKPRYAPSPKSVFLKSLKNIEGVNRLAQNQHINFGGNITLIYGENGSGKTGYGRILKSLGFSYDPSNKILHNIQSAPIPQTAHIEFESNGQTNIFNWKGNNTHPELSKISVFNNSCVHLSLMDRQLIVSPIGFHLFKLVTSELEELSTLLAKKISQHPTDIPWINILHENTIQKQFINELSKNTTEQQLLRITSFTQELSTALDESEKELTNLNPTLIQTQLQNIKYQIDELSKMLAKVKKTQAAISPDKITLLKSTNLQIENAKSNNKNSLKDIAKKNGITFYESAEFFNFIESAERYINILRQGNYPQKGDQCIYCKQSLDENSRELLENYKRLLNDTTQSELKKLDHTKKEILLEFSSLDYNVSFTHPAFGINSNDQPMLPNEFTKYNEEVKTTLEFLTKKELPSDYINPVNFVPVIKTIEDKLSELQQIENKKRDSLTDISNRKQALGQYINELKDRKLLSDRIPELKTVIENHKIVSVLKSKSNEFNTASISKKTSEAREELVKQNFDTIFHQELKSLRKSHIQLDLNFVTTRGVSKVTQTINNFSLTDILSEGEQKAIALAEFLTELQLDIVSAPVIFDDPVNSLDDKITDEVAKRLIELSKSRQVIIFTHSLLLLNSFIQQSKLDHHKQAGVTFTFHSVRDNFGESGIVGEVEEVNSHKYYKEKLDKLLALPTNGLDEGKLAAEGYGYLRSIIEIMVEECVLQSTIKRYGKGVAFPSLMRVKGVKLDQCKSQLNDIYEKCCTSITGHSSPDVIHNTPKIVELKSDLSTIIDLRKQFT